MKRCAAFGAHDSLLPGHVDEGDGVDVCGSDHHEGATMYLACVCNGDLTQPNSHPISYPMTQQAGGTQAGLIPIPSSSTTPNPRTSATRLSGQSPRHRRNKLAPPPQQLPVPLSGVPCPGLFWSGRSRHNRSETSPACPRHVSRASLPASYYFHPRLLSKPPCLTPYPGSHRFLYVHTCRKTHR